MSLLPTPITNKPFGFLGRFKLEKIRKTNTYVLHLITLVTYTSHHSYPIINIRTVAKATSVKNLRELEQLCYVGRMRASRILAQRNQLEPDVVTFKLDLFCGKPVILFKKIRVNRKGEIVWISIPETNLVEQIYKDWLMKQYLTQGDEYALLRLKGIEHFSDYNSNTLTESIRNNVGRKHYAWWDKPPHEDCLMKLKHL